MAAFRDLLLEVCLELKDIYDRSTALDSLDYDQLDKEFYAKLDEVCRLADGLRKVHEDQPTYAPWGIDGQRDPDNPCDMFRNGKPNENNTCEEDGHALCKECMHYRCDPSEAEDDL